MNLLSDTICHRHTSRRHGMQQDTHTRHKKAHARAIICAAIRFCAPMCHYARTRVHVLRNPAELEPMLTLARLLAKRWQSVPAASAAECASDEAGRQAGGKASRAGGQQGWRGTNGSSNDPETTTTRSDQEQDLPDGDKRVRECECASCVCGGG